MDVNMSEAVGDIPDPLASIASRWAALATAWQLCPTLRPALEAEAAELLAEAWEREVLAR